MSVESTASADNIPQQIAWAVVNLPPYVWLIICGLGSAAIYQLGFAVRYSLSAYGDQPFQTDASLNGLSAEGAFIFVASFLALFGLYWLGLRKGLRPPTKTQWFVVGMFAVAFNGFLINMYPMDAADIYDYIIRGRMTAVYGMNPMMNTPSELPADPFYDFAAPTWRHTSSAYGPAWEVLAGFGSRIAGDDNTANVIVFKLISILGYAATALLVALTLLIVAPKRALAGFYLFAWNPLVLVMTAGIGHNDAVMTACIALSVYFLARRWYVASTLAAILGMLVKFIPILLVPVIAIVAFRQLRGQVRIRYFILSAVLGALLILAVYAPYGNMLESLRLESRTAMYTGSVATLARQTLALFIDGHTGESSQTPKTNNFLRWALLGTFAVFYFERLDHLFRKKYDDDPIYPVRVMTMILLFYVMVTATWFQSWYVVWLVALAAILDNTPMRRMILYFSYFATWQSFLYNYVTLRSTGWAPIPWRDLIPVAFVQFTAWLYVIYFWISTWMRYAARQPFAIKIGDKLRSARQEQHLTPTDIADTLDIRTDDLIAYEQGTKAIPLSQLPALVQVLNVTVDQLFDHEPTTLAAIQAVQ